MKRIVFLFLLLLTATITIGQQKPAVDRSTENRIQADRATWSRYYMGLPHGHSPFFPGYVPDSLKDGAFYRDTVAHVTFSYNKLTGLWEPVGGAGVSTASGGVVKVGSDVRIGDGTLTGDITWNTSGTSIAFNSYLPGGEGHESDFVHSAIGNTLQSYTNSAPDFYVALTSVADDNTQRGAFLGDEYSGSLFNGFSGFWVNKDSIIIRDDIHNKGLFYRKHPNFIGGTQLMDYLHLDSLMAARIGAPSTADGGIVKSGNNFQLGTGTFHDNTIWSLGAKALLIQSLGPDHLMRLTANGNGFVAQAIDSVGNGYIDGISISGGGGAIFGYENASTGKKSYLEITPASMAVHDTKNNISIIDSVHHNVVSKLQHAEIGDVDSIALAKADSVKGTIAGANLQSVTTAGDSTNTPIIANYFKTNQATDLTGTTIRPGTYSTNSTYKPHLLIENKSAGPTRIQIEPKGQVYDGTVTKLDFMTTPYDTDLTNYGNGTIVGQAAMANLHGENGSMWEDVKSVGNGSAVFPSYGWGFSNFSSNGTFMKAYYYNMASGAWYTPMRGQWVTGKPITTGDYILASGNIYQATSTGTAGVTVPSFTSGSGSDGSVTYNFVALRGTLKPSLIIGDQADMPKFGINTNTRIQFAKDALFFNGAKYRNLNSSGVEQFESGVDAATSDYFIRNLTTSGYLKFAGVGGISSTDIISYTSAPTFSTGLQLVDKTYADTKVAQTTTVAGFALSGNITLANLSATDGSLTFSGAYNGSTARTIGLNTANANHFTAVQTFDNLVITGAGLGTTTLIAANSATSGTATFPIGSYTVVGAGVTQALTNKTLTAPKLTGYTVATLPTPSVGMLAYVTDALSPTALATVVGGGSITVPVFYNGTNWIVE